MQSRGLIHRLIASAAIVSILSLSIFADTIRLKDGSIIKGKIVRFTGGVFSIQIGDGSRKREMTFSADEIESIQFDAPDLRPNAEVRDKPSSIINVSTASSNPPRVITTDSTLPANDSSTVPNDPPVEKKPIETPKAPVQTPTSKSQPIELNLKVLADATSNGWTNSGWVVRKGQRIRISGDGTVSLGKGQKSSPSGLPDLADDQKLLKSVATGALIAVIGDDNNDFIYIGAQREFTASRDGTLFLGVNEGNLDDNSGSYNVKIQIVPGSGN